MSSDRNDGGNLRDEDGGSKAVDGDAPAADGPRRMIPPVPPAKTPAGPAVAAPQPSPAGPAKAPERADPTRFGDWEKNGRCIDF